LNTGFLVLSFAASIQRISQQNSGASNTWNYLYTAVQKVYFLSYLRRPPNEVDGSKRFLFLIAFIH